MSPPVASKSPACCGYDVMTLRAFLCPVSSHNLFSKSVSQQRPFIKSLFYFRIRQNTMQKQLNKTHNKQVYKWASRYVWSLCLEYDFLDNRSSDRLHTWQEDRGSAECRVSKQQRYRGPHRAEGRGPHRAEGHTGPRAEGHTGPRATQATQGRGPHRAEGRGPHRAEG